MTNIQYQTEPNLAAAEFVDILKRSTLAQRRPVEETKTIVGMLAGADLIIAARTDDGLLVGVARSISDFHYCTYLSDLAVDVNFQNQGIGKRLVEETQAKTPGTSLILLAAPAAEDYYPHIGFAKHQSCWIKRRPAT